MGRVHGGKGSRWEVASYRHSRAGGNPVPLDSRLRGNDVGLILRGFPSAARLKTIPFNNQPQGVSRDSRALKAGQDGLLPGRLKTCPTFE